MGNKQDRPRGGGWERRTLEQITLSGAHRPQVVPKCADSDSVGLGVANEAPGDAQAAGAQTRRTEGSVWIQALSADPMSMHDSLDRIWIVDSQESRRHVRCKEKSENQNSRKRAMMLVLKA